MVLFECQWRCFRGQKTVGKGSGAPREMISWRSIRGYYFPRDDFQLSGHVRDYKPRQMDLCLEIDDLLAFCGAEGSENAEFEEPFPPFSTFSALLHSLPSVSHRISHGGIPWPLLATPAWPREAPLRRTDEEMSPTSRTDPVPAKSMVSHKKHSRIKRCSTPPASVSEEEDEPQMSTPDDPVIHSPPSLGGQLMSGAIPKLEDGIGMNCTSLDAAGIDPNGDSEARRRQKTCRVCGDHATGYNFNVITCESCKAFFRRNALRPKEFKCPYSEDCDINAVSRRFCQKCRLRKCFSVGMKKEWILNEEQLRRRKNSRLNNMQNQQRQKHHQEMIRQPSQMKGLPAPLSINPMDQINALGLNHNMSQLMSPTPGYSMMSPSGSIASSADSPPGSRPMGIVPIGQRSPDQYQPNIMNLRADLAPSTPLSVDPARKQVILSMDAYQNLVQRAGKSQDESEPPHKRSLTGFSPEIAMPQPRNYGSPLMPSVTSAFMMNSSSTYMDLADVKPQPQFPPGYAERMERMSNYFDKTIEEALKLDSPDQSAFFNMNQMNLNPSPTKPDAQYQLNAAELQALDVVKEAFKGMNDEVEPGRQKQSFLKTDKTPADIMNIMDVAMRRLVKMAKKLNAFNDLTQDGKFALLKAAMVEMLTVRGVSRFDSRQGVWRTPTMPEPVEVSFDMFDKLNKDIRGDQKTRVMQFFKVFSDDIRGNDLIISLIILIVLFSPREVITEEHDKKLMSNSHEEFSNLLLRYLESLYGTEAQGIYSQIPDALKMLKEISSHSALLFFGTVNTAEAEALPREIFKVE